MFFVPTLAHLQRQQRNLAGRKLLPPDSARFGSLLDRAACEGQRHTTCEAGATLLRPVTLSR